MKSETLNKINDALRAARAGHVTATASSAAKKSPRSVCARCRSRSAARTAKRRGKWPQQRERADGAAPRHRVAVPRHAGISPPASGSPSTGCRLAAGASPSVAPPPPSVSAYHHPIVIVDQEDRRMSDQFERPISRRSTRTSRSAIGRSRFRRELPILPLRDTVLFPEFVHAARRRPRELGPPDRRCDRQRQADRGVHPARRVGRRAGAGRPVSGRHRHAHPQDVQAARRQPAADRPGAGAAEARARSCRRARTCAARVSAADEDMQRRRSPRDRRAAAQHQDATSSRSCRCRRCCPTICRRWPPTSPSPGGSPTSSPRACRPSARRSSRRCSRRSTSARGWTT